MKNFFYALICIAIVSCSGYKQDLFYDSIQKAQIDFKNDSIKNEFFPNNRLVCLHENRRHKLLELNCNLNVKNGYVFILDQFGDSYSPHSCYGNIWSKKDNIYYKFDALDNSFEVTNSYYDGDWVLFKRAVEEWDLSQIDKYYREPGGFGQYIASRIEFKNNKIVNIQTYAWHD